MAEIMFREFEIADVPATFRLGIETFPMAKWVLADWEAWVSKDFTGVVAYEGTRLLGMLNLKKLTYRVAPGAQLAVWVQHGVATDESVRGKGVGSGIQRKARELLKGRGDMTLVYRGAEKSPAYHFYMKSGLYDVGTARSYQLAGNPGATLPPPCRILSEETFFARAADVFTAYRKAREDLAGQPEKDVNTMKRQVGATCSMRGADYRFVYLVRTAGDAITDYCVLAGAGDYLKIMDFTATTSLVAQELLSGALALTPALALDASPGTLLEAAALSLGATTNSRDLSVTFMMAGILDVESAGAKVWRSVPALDNVEVRVWTAERDGVIHWVKSPERTITLEMKEPTLSAMLCRRLSVKTAIEEERITVVGHREGDIDALNEALRPCAWHYDFIDHL